MGTIAKSCTIALTQRQAAALCHAVEAHRDELAKWDPSETAEILENRRELVKDLDALLSRIESVSEEIGDGRLLLVTGDEAHLLHFVLAFRYEQIDEELGDHGWAHRHLSRLADAIGEPVTGQD